MEEAERLQAIKGKQVQLLHNKKVVNHIYANAGPSLLAKGTVLPLEDTQNAQLAGPSVVTQLSMKTRSLITKEEKLQ
nr:hypothetical protein [Niallia taxi]